jgi:hypothetical protein
MKFQLFNYKFNIFYLLLLFFLLSEIVLRSIGFGDPILYENKRNYYPKSNQNVTRLNKSKVIINNFGMRTNYNWNNTINSKKIIFFGDSVLFGGSYIDNSELFSDKLCSMISNSICGNYGVNGYRVENLKLRISEVKDKFEFDHLIIVVSESIQMGQSKFQEFPFYEQFNFKIFKSTREILNHILFKYNLMNNYHKKIKTIKKKSNHNKNSIGDLISILNEISNSKTKVKIIILPTLENLNRGKIKKHVLEKINSNQIKVFNMFNNFRTINYEELYFNNAHLNKKGHDYFAKIIYNTIK